MFVNNLQTGSYKLFIVYSNLNTIQYMNVEGVSVNVVIYLFIYILVISSYFINCIYAVFLRHLGLQHPNY